MDLEWKDRLILARAAFEIPTFEPGIGPVYTFTTGIKSPVYNDNRRFLGFPEYRRLIAKGFQYYINSKNIQNDRIAGVETSGIPFATTLGDLLVKPIIYIRKEAKCHGLRHKIEGLVTGLEEIQDLHKENIILVEDSITTGASSGEAVQAIRDTNGICNYCFCIFTYGFQKSIDLFENMNPRCEIVFLLDCDFLLNFGKKIGKINKDQEEEALEWRNDYPTWAEKYGVK